MNVLVIGASGQVGSCLMARGKALGWQMQGTYHTQARAELMPLNLLSASDVAVALDRLAPDVVIHAATWAWVDGNERDRARAFVENVNTVEVVVSACAERDIRYCYYSSSYVFDGGKNAPYTESDPVCPISVYGETKVRAEEMVRRAFGDAALIIRTVYVYGPDPQEKNFYYQLKRAVAEKKVVQVPVDQLGNPTYGPDLAAATLELVTRRESGIWHVGGPDMMLSRLSFAQQIVARLGASADMVVGVPTAAMQQPAARPFNGCLAIDKLTAAGIGMRSVADILKNEL